MGYDKLIGRAYKGKTNTDGEQDAGVGRRNARDAVLYLKGGIFRLLLIQFLTAFLHLFVLINEVEAYPSVLGFSYR